MTRQSDGSSSGDRGALARSMLFNTVGSLTYQGCLWLITVLVVTLSTGYENSGLLASAMATGNMFFAVGTYNMRTYQASDIRGQHPQATYVALRLITIALAWLIFIPYVILTSSNNLALAVCLVYLVYKADECMADVLYGVDQKAQRMDLVGVSQLLRGTVVISSFCVSLYLTNSLLVAIAIMCVVTITVTITFDVRRAGEFDTIRPSISRQTCFQLLRECLPVALAPLLTNMVVSVSRQCYLTLYGYEALGAYAAIATPAVLVQAAARYLYLPLLVPIAEVWEDGDARAFMHVVAKVFLTMLVISIVAIGVLSVAGMVVLPMVYGKSIEGSAVVFPGVLAGTAAIALFWFLTDVLIVCRDTFGQLVASSAAFACSAVIMLPCERAFEMHGINLTIAVSIVVGIVVALVRLAGKMRQSDEGVGK